MNPSRALSLFLLLLLASLPSFGASTLQGPFETSGMFYITVPNGGFELQVGSALSSWSLTGATWTQFGRDGIHVYAGASAAGLIDASWSSANTLIELNQSFNIQPSTSYVLSAWVWNGISGGAASYLEFGPALVIQNDGGGAGTCRVDATSGAGDWEFLICPFTTSLNATQLTLHLIVEGNVQANSVMAFDDVSITIASAFSPPVSALQDNDGDGWTLGDGDCDDNEATTYPQALEPLDGVDNDCSGIIDDGVYDLDGDGTCPDPVLCDDGTTPGDCDDTNPDLYPGRVEDCDGVDQNCDGVVSDEYDADNDGYRGCEGDCNDDNAQQAPDLPEVCNHMDDNCDGNIDEGLDAAYRYEDKDGDGFGDGDTRQLTCDTSNPLFVKDAGDCDDSDPTVNPDAVELCDDAIDSDCNGAKEPEGDCPTNGQTCGQGCNGTNTKSSSLLGLLIAAALLGRRRFF